MSLLPQQQGGALYKVFKDYGDGLEGRQRATSIARFLLEKSYGSSYQFNFYGTYVVNGLITKAYVDRYNILRNGGATIAAAMSTLENEGAVRVAFVKTENPRYINPYYVEYRISPFDITDKHEFSPLALQRLKYKGCKLSGTSINANSTETTDGGPVVKITRVNQNQIVFSNNTVTTARANTSGLPVRQLTSRDFSAGTGRVSETVSSAPTLQD
jgi:hypothetical protein